MIGSGYWATGITVRYGYSGMDRYGWSATVRFYDDGFADDDPDKGIVSTEGTLTTRYCVRDGRRDGLAVAIDTVKADAERLGITWQPQPAILYESDGDSKAYPPPDDWKGMLNDQARRIGWTEALYAVPAVAAKTGSEEK